MPARHPKTVNPTSVARANTKFDFVFACHRWVHYTPPPGTDEKEARHLRRREKMDAATAAGLMSAVVAGVGAMVSTFQ